MIPFAGMHEPSTVGHIKVFTLINVAPEQSDYQSYLHAAYEKSPEYARKGSHCWQCRSRKNPRNKDGNPGQERTGRKAMGFWPEAGVFSSTTAESIVENLLNLATLKQKRHEHT